MDPFHKKHCLGCFHHVLKSINASEIGLHVSSTNEAAYPIALLSKKSPIFSGFNLSSTCFWQNFSMKLISLLQNLGFEYMKNTLKTNELTAQIEAEFRDFTEKVSLSKKMKGRNRLQYIEDIRDKDYKRIKTYINHLESSINYNETSLDKKELKQKREEVEAFHKALEKLIRSLQSSKNEVLTVEVLFGNRADEKNNLSDDRQQLIGEITEAQNKSEESAKRALQYMYEMHAIGKDVNVELQRQIEKLDEIYQTLQETESTMNRALRHINYFARSVYTDKLLMGLIILIVLAVIAIIILSAMGKLPSANQDSIK